jgi:hypothetical protein
MHIFNNGVDKAIKKWTSVQDNKCAASGSDGRSGLHALQSHQIAWRTTSGNVACCRVFIRQHTALSTIILM